MSIFTSIDITFMFKKKRFQIHSYMGYGNHIRLRASGRVLKDKYVNFEGNLGALRTLRNVYKQFESDELPNVTIQLTLSNDTSYTTITDAEGYYHFDEVLTTPLTIENQWVMYQVAFIPETHKLALPTTLFEGKMLVPSPQAKYGIISDIDDTILHTGVASVLKWRLIVNTFFRNFDKRKPLAGTAAFYTKFQSGTTYPNPIFYVSNSPWNLYEYLKTFLKTNRFPEGPILLRDFRTPFDKTPKPKHPHKQSEILNLLELYPNMNFILIGDTGEKDADIYTTIANRYPNRILAIYLQSVPYKRKEKRIQKLIADFTTVPILLIKDTADAESHARKLGFIA